MAMTKRMFAAIEKVEDQDDGTVKVWGYASAPSVDSDGETITADAMKAAIPDYLKFGAVREMHQAKAAGTAIECEVQDDGRTWFGAHVVDSEAVKKVKANVYKGFSIGGKITSRDSVEKTTITGLKLVEVSLVDRPANPDAVFTMFKAETEMTAIEELAKLVNDGVVTPEQLLALAKGDLTDEEIAAIRANSDAAAEVKAQEIATTVVEPAPAPDGEASAKADTDTPLRKSMWQVSRFADMLASVGSIAADSAREAEWEGDNSPVPAKLREWLGQGAAIFAEMAAEEIAEMMEALAPDADGDIVVETIELADTTDDLAKAGARNSAADQKRLQEMHDMAVAMGASCGEGEKAKAEVVEAAEPDSVAKMFAANSDAIKKALMDATEPLAKRIAELEAQPVAPKAVLKVVGKESDIIDTTKAEDMIDTTGMTPEQIAFAEVKKLHKMGGKSLI